MAQKINITLIDDVDGSEATETISFGIDGAQFEIDLSEGNAAKLRAAIQTYATAGRRVGGRQRGRVSTGPDPKAVRAWAKSVRIDVPARGRIPSKVLEKYRAAGH